MLDWGCEGVCLLQWSRAEGEAHTLKIMDATIQDTDTQGLWILASKDWRIINCFKTTSRTT